VAARQVLQLRRLGVRQLGVDHDHLDVGSGERQDALDRARQVRLCPVGGDDDGDLAELAVTRARAGGGPVHHVLVEHLVAVAERLRDRDPVVRSSQGSYLVPMNGANARSVTPAIRMKRSQSTLRRSVSSNIPTSSRRARSCSTTMQSMKLRSCSASRLKASARNPMRPFGLSSRSSEAAYPKRSLDVRTKATITSRNRGSQVLSESR
jgi:hypothetical protein